MFWAWYVVPLTNRPTNLHFKTNSELKKLGKGDQDLCIAQLHYSVLWHLARAFQFKKVQDLDTLTEAFARLCGGIDVAFELLERFSNPTKYPAWIEAGNKGGQGAKEAWKKAEKHPLQHIYFYRNHLIHGRLTPRMLPPIASGTPIQIPKVGKETDYLDWRILTDPTNNPGLNLTDLDTPEKSLQVLGTTP